MKALTTILLFFVVFMALTVEADAGSFNLSVAIDPGFTIGRGPHTRRHRAHVRNEDGRDDATDLPEPGQIHQFDVPEVFTHDAAAHGGSDDPNDEDPARDHGGPHRHHRRH